MHGNRICRSRGAGRKGVSTVVGMTIFLLLFAIAVAYIFMWSQNSGIYIDTVKKQVDFERSRLTENLIITAENRTAVLIENPTAQVIVVTQVWSNNSMVWLGERGIAPFAKTIIVNDSALEGNGNFTVITYRGNIFSGGFKAQLEEATRRSWEVTWYWHANVSDVNYTAYLPSNTLSGLQIGATYWYDLNLDYEWDYLNNPVIAQSYTMNESMVGNQTYGTIMAFVAKTTLIKLSDNSSDAWVNVFFSQGSKVANSTTATLPIRWYDQIDQPIPILISGDKYSIHEIYIYFEGFGRDDAQLRLNVVNATFAR